ncbi:hypothetical protein [Paracoccus sp. TOH]|uniref:tetratricopeptide repeat protein n=1 Tax=Paracoccus sp. TOH TaxID=1263728 RepID=UPI0025AFB90A|nr:hypothetical protein [Paracoccus sp. TOH]WJS86324.1 hypothetical protein NBE95_13190 [Paracoccus sp. TOH]
MTATTIFEDNHVSVYFSPAAEGKRSDVAVLSYSPMNHDFAARGIPALAALRSHGFDVFGIIARQNNWYPKTSLTQAAEALGNFLQGYSRKVGYGSSMGGYAAIKYSALMGCDCVLSLAPQVSIDPSDVPWDGRFAKYFSPNLHQDMNISSDDVAGTIYVVADPMLAVDLRHFCEVETLQSGQAFLVPAYFCDHYVVNPIASRTILAAMFSAVLDSDIEKVRGVYRKARKESSYYRGALMHALALRRMKQGHLDAALAACEVAVESMPMFAEFLLTKSKIHMVRKEREAAITAARQAVDLDPMREWYRRVLSEAEAS